MKNKDFEYYVTTYFSNYLPSHTGFSNNTIQSYRDIFVIFIKYCNDNLKIKPNKLTFSKINKSTVEEFLGWLESNNCSVSTRNQRLAGIRSFFKYVQGEAPQYFSLCTEILSIRTKKAPTPTITYLTLEGIKVLLSQPNVHTKSGRRDLSILAVLYDTGARVQELVDLKLENVRTKQPSTIQLTGKGNKTRIIPITKQTAQILDNYFKDTNLSTQEYIFTNNQGTKLTRAGVAYILKKYIDTAKQSNPIEFTQTVSPHILRHSKAMHLLEANVNLIYIRDFLGHVSVETTQIYAKANPEIKRKYIEESSKILIPEEKYTDNEKADLLSWLLKNI